MIKKKMYSYIGYNGSVITPIILPLEGKEFINLTAKDGFILTNGSVETKSITVLPSEVEEWIEKPFQGIIE